MADITFVNLNMLFVRYADAYDKELHLPLGLLYLTTVLERAGYDVDFRDYQTCPADDPFDLDAFAAFCAKPAPIIGLSCMANLLPFRIACSCSAASAPRRWRRRCSRGSRGSTSSPTARPRTR
jgi:hypothetical protein